MKQITEEKAKKLVNACSELSSLAEVIKDSALDASGYESHKLWVFSQYLKRIEEDIYDVAKEYEL